jgi:hypothetical protein
MRLQCVADDAGPQPYLSRPGAERVSRLSVAAPDPPRERLAPSRLDPPDCLEPGDRTASAEESLGAFDGFVD